ncbi:MAG: GTP-binding protein, partial [Ruegeria sp.]
AEQVFAAPEQMELKLRQMAFSDMIILNKVDLVEEETVNRVHEWLASRFKRYRLVEAVNADVPLDILLSVGRFSAKQLDAEVPDEGDHERHSHQSAFEPTFFETDHPVQLVRLRQAVKDLPGSVYRVKGFVHSEEEPDYRIVVQVVGKRIDIAREEPWGSSKPMTRLVAIGAPGSVTRDMLSDIFLETA